MTQILHTFPAGFFDRHMTGPCNSPVCRHPDCWEMRIELREYAERQLLRHIAHARRKAKVRR